MQSVTNTCSIPIDGYQILMKCQSIRNAHGRSEILGMLSLPSGDIVSLGLDGHIKVWSCGSLKLKLMLDVSLPSPYLHCFSLTSKGISVGLANGTIIFLDPSDLKILQRVKLHDDLPTNLLETSHEFISAGLDGVITRFNKDTFEVNSRTKVPCPIWKIRLFNDDLYISGDSGSFKITDFLKGQGVVEQLDEKYKGFEQFEGQLYGYNQKEIRSITSQQSINEGCDYLFNCNGKLSAVRQKQIGIIKGRSSCLDISWSSIPELEEGYEIRSSVVHSNKVYLSGDSGSIYTILLQ